MLQPHVDNPLGGNATASIEQRGNKATSLRIGRTLLSVIIIGIVITFAFIQSKNRLHDGIHTAVGFPATQSDSLRPFWPLPISIPGLRYADFSPDNKYLATVSEPKDMVFLFDISGTIMWNKSIDGVNRVVAGPNGQIVMSYASMDPMRPALTIVQGAHAEKVYRYVLDSAIWDAKISKDGHYGIVTTGDKSLYVFTFGTAAPTLVRLLQPNDQNHSLPGIGVSVNISNDNSYIVCSTWDSSGVYCYTMDGTLVWSYQEQKDKKADHTNNPQENKETAYRSDLIFENQISRNSQLVMGLSYVNVQQRDPALYLWRLNKGHLLWQEPYKIENDDEFVMYPKAMISGDGSHIAVSYLHTLTHQNKSATEQRLIVLDKYEDVQWDKGGFLLSPNLVAISYDGLKVTITDGKNTLYNYDQDGRISGSLSFESSILNTYASDDNRLVLAYTSDGRLYLVTV